MMSVVYSPIRSISRDDEILLPSTLLYCDLIDLVLPVVTSSVSRSPDPTAQEICELPSYCSSIMVYIHCTLTHGCK
jgi:hypothetical protein